MSDQVKAISKKSVNISDWYNDLIYAAKLAEHGPSKGTIIIRPLGYAIWENIQKILDEKIKVLGAQNCYFPLFIPLSFLQKEKSHVQGFSPELAVVTHGGGEELTEPLVVRPTSETVMYDAFSRWIQSFRDLPLVINQWCNVVRWEKRPYLFLRGTEFLWQEGHSVHQSLEEAQKMTRDALDVYIDTYQTYLALFGIAGRKSDSEKFAGAEQTFTYEMLMPDGKAVQGCTSHNLAQNFSKAFNVQFQDEKGEHQLVWQTSWGFSTRSIGPLILVHGDDNGLVLPPMVAPTQVLIIPIVRKDTPTQDIMALTQKCFSALEEVNIRVKIDDSDQTSGWKFNQADLEGTPIRIEIGPDEAKTKELKIVRRDTKIQQTIGLEKIVIEINQLLSQIQKDLFEKSKALTVANTYEIDDYQAFQKLMETSRGFIKAFWCEEVECEEKIKQETKASTRCLPLDSLEENGSCIYCQKSAKFRWLFAQSY